MTIGEFFGTLQASITEEWRKHLQSDSYAEHKILEEYYEGMVDLVDALIEGWQADNEVVEDYTDLLAGKDLEPTEYIKEIQRITTEGRELLGTDVLKSECDDILKLITSTLYKLKHLVKESFMDLRTFIGRDL